MTDTERRAVRGSEAEFGVDVVDVDGRLRVIAVTGDLDARTAPLVLEAATAHPAALGADTVLDFTAVTFCGADGLNVAVQLNQLASLRGGRLTVRGASRTVRRLFAACGLDGLLGSARTDGARDDPLRGLGPD
jgi:anti-sigma B factor antagonist